MGTTAYGQDVYAQFVSGLGTTFIVGIIGGGLATLIGMFVGFMGGYKGGWLDEFLNVITNIILVIPTFALLLIMVAYLKLRGVLIESIFIGLTSWPWAARAIRAQTFSLANREFVDLAKLSGMKTLRILFGEIAPNMMSYLFMTFILQFGGAISDRGHPRFYRLGTHARGFIRLDDELGHEWQCAAVRLLVVVCASRYCHYGRSRRALYHECRPG